MLLHGPAVGGCGKNAIHEICLVRCGTPRPINYPFKFLPFHVSSFRTSSRSIPPVRKRHCVRSGTRCKTRAFKGKEMQRLQSCVVSLQFKSDGGKILWCGRGTVQSILHRAGKYVSVAVVHSVEVCLCCIV